MITVAFRLDDPSQISDHQLEKRILDLFKRYEVSITFAVIPFHFRNNKYHALTVNGVKHIILAEQSGIVEIAQHGYAHIKNNHSIRNKNSEFVSLPYNDQKEKIIKGKKILDEIFQHEVKGFVPPFNSFDKNTIKILIQQRFSYLSAGWDVPEPMPSNISIIPRTCSLKNAQQTLKEAKNIGKLSSKIIIVLHHDDFEEFCNADNSPDHPSFTNLAKLELLLQVISDDSEIEIKALNQITETPGDYIHAIKNHAWFLKQNWRIRRYLPCTMLLKQTLPILIIYLLKAFFKRKLFFKKYMN